ncbi:non-ribosomal peptide synthetase [Cohnella sp. CFH 77786]|uniref:non-ribosomal peptide synthetase n=1 Tax=Cohnella sp. CFH 77786 TaxID=2662265 RepID=UPI001C610837|nr:non-ribosomal peptide synthetase [Cohnella sp. CFH 77786]
MGVGYHTLTHAQKRVWYTERIYPGTSLHNITGSVRIRGPLDFRLLERAILEQVRLHDALRLRVDDLDGSPVQYTAPIDHAATGFYDFTASTDPEADYSRWVEKTASLPFRLDNAPLIGFPMFRLAEGDGGFLVKFHHLVSDGWSSSMLIERIRDSYERLLKGEPGEDGSAPSYLDYVKREAEYVRSARFHRDGRFWRDRLAGWPPEQPPEPTVSLAGRRKTFRIDPQRSAAVKTFAAEAGGSLTGFFIFLYLLYAYKSSGRPETVIGTPVFNRSGPKEKATAGMFTSTMPFRFAFDDNASSVDTLSRIGRELAHCYHHQKYPYDLLAQDLQLKKRGIDRLFDVSVNTYNTRVIREWAGWPAEVTEHHGGNQLFSLQLVVKDWSGDGLTVEIDYKTAERTEEQVDVLFKRLIALMDNVLSAPGEPVGRLTLLNEADKRQFAAYNATGADYPRNKTIHRLVEEQAERTPDATAVTFGPARLTYRQLNEKADRLAAWLASRGVGRQTAVGLLVRHATETVVAILAALKAGAAYVPVDPDYPAERIGYMLADSGCVLLLANVAIPEGTGFAGPVGRLDDPALYAETPVRLPEATPEDLAYIIYTSGSTGRPKGVMIDHRGLVNYIWWACRQYVKDECEVFPLYSSLAFDLTVTSVFTPLVSGGSIAVYRDDEDEYVLHRIMKDKRSTVVKLTPSHLSLLQDLDNRGSSVKRFIVGGEDLRTDLAKRIHDSFGGRIEICNEYGPTETVVGCMIHKYDPRRDIRASVPIGVPADNVGIHVLDAQLNPVPEQVLGELYITGDGLARGYRNRPDLTAERFVPCPFLPGRLMYRTGDLARRLEDGKIEYAGRVDRQVKIRGHRIELGEIERALTSHASVREAVVIDHEAEDGGKCLCAYVVRSSGEAADLLSYLHGMLPSYMIPASIAELERIPLNSNGKVDRGRLPEPSFGRAAARRVPDNRTQGQETSVLIVAARDVLQTDDLSSDDHFYQAGGDSIKAIQLASKLRSAGFSIKVADILAYPVFGEMAERMTAIGSDARAEEPAEGEVPSTPIYEWFVSQPFAERHHYVQSVLLRLKRSMTAQEAETIVRGLIAQHDSLRLGAAPSTRGLRYNGEARIEPVETFDLTGLAYEEQLRRMSEIGERLKAGFRLDRDALLKACLFELGGEERRLLLVAHHIAVDAVSWTILLEDFVRLHRNLTLPEPLPLPAKTVSYRRWAEHLRSRAEEAEKELLYWRQVLEKGNAEADRRFMPRARSSREGTAGSATVMERLSAEDTERLLKESHAAYGTNTQDLLVAALAAAVSETFGLTRPVIELEGHGREPGDPSVDLSRTVGWFTCLYPVRLPQVEGIAWAERIKAVKETLRQVPSKGIGFGILTRLSRRLDDPGAGARIRLNYVGELDASLGGGDLFALSDEPSGLDSGAGNPPTAPFDIAAMVIGGRMRLVVAYDRAAFDPETATGFAGCFAGRIEELIRHCCGVRERVYTPSDFATVALSQKALDSLFQ